MDKILYTGKDLSEAGAYGFQVQGVTAPARVICCGAVASAWWPGGGGRRGRMLRDKAEIRQEDHSQPYW